MGLRHINFDLDLQFDDPESRWLSEQVLLFGLNVLAVQDVYYLRRHPDTPKLYDSGMVYMVPEQFERRPSASQIADFKKFLAGRMRMTPAEIEHHVDLARGVEIFRDIPRMLAHGGGDCDNCCAMRNAELVVAGVKGAKPRLTHRRQGGRTIYHAIVLWPDGSSEDPSIILGMGGEDKRAERREECRKNVERYDNLWQDARRMMADLVDLPRDVRLARAAELKARIDALGLLPKDGVFRVGPRRDDRSSAGALDARRVLSADGLDVFRRAA